MSTKINKVLNMLHHAEETERELIIERDEWRARAADYLAVNALCVERADQAEAAENDLRELRENILLALGLNPVNVADGTEDATIAYLLSGLKDRIAALESQLAAQAWRPVTEPPDKADWRSGFLVATVSEFVYYADEYSKGAWLWGDGWMKEIAGVTHWQPLPAPPQDTPASGRRQYNQDKS